MHGPVGRPGEARAVRPRGVARRGLGGESARGHRVLASSHGRVRTHTPARLWRARPRVPARWGERAGRAQVGRARRQGTGAGDRPGAAELRHGQVQLGWLIGW